MKSAALPLSMLDPVHKVLHRHLAGENPGRSKAVIHASDVTQPDFCARRVALYRASKRAPKPERVTTSQEVTWEIGRMLQNRLAHWFADAGVCYGHWDCRICGTRHELTKRPHVCTTKGCNSKWFKYEEVRVMDPVSGISCGLDILILREDGKLHIVECKTIKDDKFKELVAPLAEHRARTRLYLHCTAQDQNPRLHNIRTDTAIILYCTKRGWGSSNPDYKNYDFWDGSFTPFKEYQIVADPAEVQAYLDKATPAHQYKQGGPLPERICNTSFTPIAKDCGVCDLCFGAA